MNPPLMGPAHSIAVFDRKPVSKPLPVRVAPVAMVDQVTQLVHQDVIEIESPDRGRRPDQPPGPARGGFPPAAVHLRLAALRSPRRTTKMLHERFIHGVQVQRRAPLHPITGQRPLLARHTAQLDHLQTPIELRRQLRQTRPNLRRRHRVPITRARRLHDDPIIRPAPTTARLVPVFRRQERAARPLGTARPLAMRKTAMGPHRPGGLHATLRPGRRHVRVEASRHNALTQREDPSCSQRRVGTQDTKGRRNRTILRTCGKLPRSPTLSMLRAGRVTFQVNDASCLISTT